MYGSTLKKGLFYPLRVTAYRKVCPKVTKRASRRVLRQAGVPSSNVLRVPVSLAQSAQAQSKASGGFKSQQGINSRFHLWTFDMCAHDIGANLETAEVKSIADGDSQIVRAVVQQVILIVEIRQRHRSHLQHGPSAQDTFGARTDVCNEPAGATISARAAQKRT